MTRCASCDASCATPSDLGAVNDDALGHVQRARSASSSSELQAIYADWASSYDEQVFGELGFTGSRRIADLLAEHAADRSLPVLDLGCGTGACGARLAEHGFLAVDGVDLSPEMLAVAAGKGCYRALDVADLTTIAELPRGGYAASVSAGTFTSGHVGAEHLGPILAAHTTGAVLAWVVAEAVWLSFEQALLQHGVEIVLSDLESVREGGQPESRMLIARSRA